jgi:hypothetical protein
MTTREQRAPHDTNTATLPATDTNNGRNYADKYETIGRKLVVAWDQEKGEFAYPVDARFYMARKSDGASPVYCSVWIRTRDGHYFAGHGLARGYGYDKKSAALDAALDSAGIALAARIDGCGDSTARVALLAIADAAGYDGCPREVVS